MTFSLQILGSAAATPSQSRHPSSQILRINNENYLIDCGEGTQMRLKDFNIKISKINNIFISHLHGDHYLGLMGLLLTMNLYHRTRPLNLYAPKGLAEIITTQLKFSDTTLDFKLNLKETETGNSKLLLENEDISVTSFPLIHRVPTCGFVFEEKTSEYNLIKEKLPSDISRENMLKLKRGEDIKDENGKVILSCKNCTYPPKKSRKFAYCSDTEINRDVIPYIRKADLLFHEATFLHELKDRASYTKHSTALQAAYIAKEAEVKKLIIGHFSSRYKDASPLVDEAAYIFPETYEAVEGSLFEVEE